MGWDEVLATHSSWFFLLAEEKPFWRRRGRMPGVKDFSAVKATMAVSVPSCLKGPLQFILKGHGSIQGTLFVLLLMLSSLIRMIQQEYSAFGVDFFGTKLSSTHHDKLLLITFSNSFSGDLFF